MKSIEKLRKVAEEQNSPVMCKLVRVYTNMNGMSASNAEVMEALGNAIDEIEEELARDYVELPKDSDGVPIHVGDVLVKTLNGNDTDIECVAEGVGDKTIFVSYDRDEEGEYGLVFYECLASLFRHKEPDTWEQIIADAVKNGYTDPDNENVQRRLVERCKKLAGEFDD